MLVTQQDSKKTPFKLLKLNEKTMNERWKIHTTENNKIRQPKLTRPCINSSKAENKHPVLQNWTIHGMNTINASSVV